MSNYTQSFPSDKQKLKEQQCFETGENREEILANDRPLCFRSLDRFSPLYPEGDKEGRLKDPTFSP